MRPPQVKPSDRSSPSPQPPPQESGVPTPRPCPPPLSKSHGDWTRECRPATSPRVWPAATRCLITHSGRDPLSRSASLIFIKAVKFQLCRQRSPDLHREQRQPRPAHARHERYCTLGNSRQPPPDRHIPVLATKEPCLRTICSSTQRPHRREELGSSLAQSHDGVHIEDRFFLTWECPGHFPFGGKVRKHRVYEQKNTWRLRKGAGPEEDALSVGSSLRAPRTANAPPNPWCEHHPEASLFTPQLCSQTGTL